MPVDNLCIFLATEVMHKSYTGSAPIVHRGRVL